MVYHLFVKLISHFIFSLSIRNDDSTKLRYFRLLSSTEVDFTSSHDIISLRYDSFLSC